MITEKLELKPFQSWRQGEPRFTPKGKALLGTYPNTSWSYRFEFKGERSFFHRLQALLESLEVHKEFFDCIISEGGQIYLNVNLAGDENIGDVLNWQTIEKLNVLRVNLGVEVFPSPRRAK